MSRKIAGTLARAAAAVLSMWCAAPTHAQIRAQLVTGTGLNLPLDGCALPWDTSRLFIVELTGLVKIVNLGDGTVNETPFVNVSPLTDPGGERGLLGMAFHPNFGSNGHVYVHYTDLEGDTVIQRFTAVPPFSNPLTTDPASGQIVITVPRVVVNHNGGHLAFGPDGMLYASLGDGGSANDPLENSQNPASLLGKILRLDVNRDDFPGDPLRNYGIPAGNPFAGAGDPGADEIWAMGLRNPWRFSFDRLTGDLWIGDVGQDSREEIDFQPALTATNLPQVAGRNYGWDCREGFIEAPSTDRDCSRATTFVDPVWDYVNGPGTDQGCSVIGGLVYRGAAIPSLRGAYFFTDLCARWIRSLRFSGGTVSDVREWSAQLTPPTGPIESLVGFCEDASGEMYIISLGGTIHKVVPDGSGGGGQECGCPCVLTGSEAVVFTDGFETDRGWTVEVGGTTAGAWQRATPVNDPNDPNDPQGAAGGSGQCFVTGNAGGADVDAGSTALVSGPLDLSAGLITLCYDYFLNLAGQSAGDGLFVDVSSNGLAGPWARVASHTADKDLLWIHAAITPAQLSAAGVLATPDVRVRFVAVDAETDGTVEAGLDNFVVYTANLFDDCNTNGTDDADDIAVGTSTDCNANGIPDECDITTGLLTDLDGGPVGIRSEGSLFFGSYCAQCHGATGTGATGPNIRNKTRDLIRARLLLSTPHPGGSFPNATAENFADIEAFLADGGSRGRPDGIPDECQVLNDCDGDDDSDGAELALGTQVDLNYDGLPDDCQPDCPAIPEDCPARCPLVKIPPPNRSAEAGDRVSLFVGVAGATPLNYQWFKDKVPLVDGGRISGSRTSTLVIDPVQSADAGVYFARVSNTCGAVRTADGRLTVTDDSVGTAADRRLHAVADHDGGLTVLYSSTEDRPVLLEQAAADAPWYVTVADAVLQLNSPTTDTLTWVDPRSAHTVAALLTEGGTFVFDTLSPTTSDANLTARIPGATAIVGSPTVFTTPDGVVHVAGLNNAGEVVLYFSTGRAEPHDWAFSNLSRAHLAPQRIPTPAFVGELAGYATPWGGRNIAGLDAAGQIFAVWWSPGLPYWRADNISRITGTPPLRGPLTAFTTPWGGLNLAGTDNNGHIVVTWWVPVFGAKWISTDLSAIVGGPSIRAGSLTSFVTPWGGQNLAGVAPDGSIELYWWAPGLTNWVATDMTALIPGAPKAAGPLTGVAGPGGAMSILGADGDGSVFRYHWHPGADWRTENVTDAAVPK